MSVFEAVMLLCFGAAWPFSIARSVKSKSTHGKSLVFLLILIAGYISGIINKILYSNDIVLYLYILNLAMVSTDAILWVRNRRLEKRAGRGEKPGGVSLSQTGAGVGETKPVSGLGTKPQDIFPVVARRRRAVARRGTETQGNCQL